MTTRCHHAIYLQERLEEAIRTRDHFPRNTPEGKRIRKEHLCFVIKIYTVAFLLLMALLIQWIEILTIPYVVEFIKKYNYCFLAVIAVSFFMFLNLIFFFHNLYMRSKILLFVFIFLTLEIGSGVYICTMESTTADIAYSLIVMILSIVISIGMANIHVSTPRDVKFIVTWSLRYFLIASILSLVMGAFKRPEVETCIALLIYVFLATFIPIFGLTIGSLQFYTKAGTDSIVLGVLFYCCCAAEFAIGVTFFKKIRSFKEQHST